MTLKLSVLASGSSGNIIYIESDKTSILIDAGLSKKRTNILLNKINKDLKDIKAIFVSHEHVDHVRGIGVINRHHNTLIYGNKDTLSCDKFKKTTGDINPDSLKYIDPHETIILDDLKITAFSTSHDSINPQSYMIEQDNKKLICLTDTGYVNDKLLSKIKDANVYLIESNHDVDLLKNGRRPEFNKQRILSEKGHLSNDDSGELLANCINENTHTIILGHMSKDHNTENIALGSVKRVLSEKCDYNLDSVDIIAFIQGNEPSEIFEV